jgi:single-strand DNA-binding protein
MPGVNRVTLVGNLGRDPDIRHLENGGLKATFSLATNEIYRNKEGERLVHTEWHNIVLWSHLADIAQKYLVKGKQVYIEGKLASRSYTDKQGQVKHITEIIAQNLLLLGSAKGSSPDLKEKEEVVLLEEKIADDLPF